MIYNLLVYLLGAERHYGYEHPLFRGLLACLVAFVIIWRIGPSIIRELICKKIGDVPDFDRASNLIDTLGDAVTFYKVGLQLILSRDFHRVVDRLRALDKHVFVESVGASAQQGPPAGYRLSMRASLR